MKRRNLITTLILPISMLSACGLMKVNINGKTYGGGGSSGTNAASVAAANGVPTAEASTVSGGSKALAIPKDKPAFSVSKAQLKPSLVSPDFRVATDARAEEYGFKCEGRPAQGYSTAAPAFSFEVAGESDVKVALQGWDGTYGILVLPNGTTHCSDNGVFPMANWPKGTYHVYLVGQSSQLGGKLAFSSLAAAEGAVPTIALAKASSAPAVVQGPVAYERSAMTQFGIQSNADCVVHRVGEVPSAWIDVKELSASARIGVFGDTLNRGMVVKAADGGVYFTCENVFGAPKAGWPKGKLAIYPIADGSSRTPMVTITVDDPLAHESDELTQKITLEHKLEKPMFIKVKVRGQRQVAPAPVSGYGCDGVALGVAPDLLLATMRPIPGLTVRPLAGRADVILRRRTIKDGASGDPFCSDQRYAKTNSSMWNARSEVRTPDEGSYELYVGAAENQDPGEVTLMLFDDSTTFDPYALADIAPEAYGSRWIARAFPQLELRTLSNGLASAPGVAEVFAKVPAGMFVYTDRNLEADMVQGGFAPGQVPQKGEPLVMLSPLDPKATRVEVVAADGAHFYLKPNYLTTAAPETLNMPTEPRPLAPTIEIGALYEVLPPSSTVRKSYQQTRESWQKCRDAAWAPYGRQLPSYSRPAGVDVVLVKNAAYNRIEAAGERAMDAKCGNEEKLNKKLEVLRQKALVEVAPVRKALLAKAVAGATASAQAK